MRTQRILGESSEDTGQILQEVPQTEFSKELALALANELEKESEKHEARADYRSRKNVGIHFADVGEGTSWGEMKKTFHEVEGEPSG